MTTWIYIICCFAALLIKTILREEYEISLGAIPTVLLYSSALGLAKLWSGHAGTNALRRRAQKAGKTPFEYARQSVDPSIIQRCESKIDQPSSAVIEYLDKLVADKVIERPYAQVLKDGYTNIINRRHPPSARAVKEAEAEELRRFTLKCVLITLLLIVTIVCAAFLYASQRK